MRNPEVRPYDKARIRRTRALCTALRVARSKAEESDGNQADAASRDGGHEKAARALWRAAGLRPLSIRQRDRKTRQDRGTDRSGHRVGRSRAQTAPQRPRASRRSDRLERERTARGSQARGRYLEAATAAMGTLLGRSPHFGPARPGRRRIFRDKAELEYIAAYGAIYR